MIDSVIRGEVTVSKDPVFKPIGVIRSPHEVPAGTPIQSRFGRDSEGQVILDEEWAPALEDVEGFERVWLIYWLHRAGPVRLRVVPYRDDREHGLFATRTPCRPNPIGLSVVEVLRREGRVLHVRGLDVLDETPLLDVKPYVPDFDAYPRSRAGWLDECREDRTHADERFHGDEDALGE